MIWSWLTFLVRISRFKYAGWRNFYADDYICLVSAILYTGLVVCLNAIADGGGSNLYEPGTGNDFTPAEIQDRIYGSKIVIVSEQASHVFRCPYDC